MHNINEEEEIRMVVEMINKEKDESKMSEFMKKACKDDYEGMAWRKKGVEQARRETIEEWEKISGKPLKDEDCLTEAEPLADEEVEKMNREDVYFTIEYQYDGAPVDGGPDDGPFTLEKATEACAKRNKQLESKPFTDGFFQVGSYA